MCGVVMLSITHSACEGLFALAVRMFVSCSSDKYLPDDDDDDDTAIVLDCIHSTTQASNMSTYLIPYSITCRLLIWMLNTI